MFMVARLLIDPFENEMGKNSLNLEWSIDNIEYSSFLCKAALTPLINEPFMNEP